MDGSSNRPAGEAGAAEEAEGPKPAAHLEDLPPLEWRPLDDICRREGFLCGHTEIDKWFRKQSLKEHSAFKSRCTTAHFLDNPAPVGFFSLRIALEDESLLESRLRQLLRSEKRVFASVQLQYIAVQRNLQRRRIGTILLIKAINEFASVVFSTGIVAMTLIAANERAAKLYQTLGFAPYGPPETRRMFLPALTAVEMVRRLPAE